MVLDKFKYGMYNITMLYNIVTYGGMKYGRY